MAITVANITAEFVGTFLLVFTVGCNVLSKNATWGAVSIACVLMVSIYALGAASGAHFNPAVSLALGLSKKTDDWKQVGAYCGAQVCGGLLAAVAYGMMFGHGFALAPKEGHVVGALMCELFYTFMLCFVVLNVATSKALQGKNQHFGLAIGFVIIAGGYGAGALGAGCFNPAVAIAITASGLGSGIQWCLLYIAVEAVGAALAWQAFQFVRPEEKDTEASVPTEYSLQSKLVCEFLGTSTLVFTVGLNVLGGSKAAAFSIAASLMCMIYAIGDISGGHFNPAVTLAILGSGEKKITAKDAGMYVGAQCGGGVLAGCLYVLAHAGDTFPLGPGDGHGWGDVAFAEMLFTFVLAFVVLCVAVKKEAPASELTAFLVGSCVTVGGFAAGGISGGSLNPAVSIGISFADIMGGGFFYQGLLYTVFELAGGAGAAVLFRVIYGGMDFSAKLKESDSILGAGLKAEK